MPSEVRGACIAPQHAPAHHAPSTALRHSPTRRSPASSAAGCLSTPPASPHRPHHSASRISSCRTHPRASACRPARDRNADWWNELGSERVGLARTVSSRTMGHSRFWRHRPSSDSDHPWQLSHLPPGVLPKPSGSVPSPSRDVAAMYSAASARQRRSSSASSTPDRCNCSGVMPFAVSRMAGEDIQYMV